VLPSFTFYATAEAVPHTGATPVFCDIDPETFCVSARTVHAALTPRTKAVIAVHLFGNVAPVAEIEALGVPVLEDAAQAAGSRAPGGARPGALGSAATFSFYPSKNLGAFGDGGAITTSDSAIAERARRLRFHGSADKETFTMVGYNSRLDAIQAAILRVQLPHLDAWAAARHAAGELYAQAGLGELVALPSATPGSTPAWHLFVVRSDRAQELGPALNERGVTARGYYRVPIHRQAPFRVNLALPHTNEAARTNLAIPIGPSLRPEQVEEVVAAVRDALASYRQRSSRSASSTCPTTRAGTPTTTARGGTSAVTTAPAPTNASSPISTPGTSTAPPPTRQARRSSAPRSSYAASWRPIVSSLVVITPGPTKTSSSTTLPRVM
jgi:dTDP-4-amino-4,6-dideoxygalactose transaminase